MPYLVIDPTQIEKYPRLAEAIPFTCPNCGGTEFMRDAFNPYYTAPNRDGFYHEYLLVKCGSCGRVSSWHFTNHVEDGLYPGERPTDPLAPGEL